MHLDDVQRRLIDPLYEPIPPAVPSTCRPGSKEKVRELMARIDRGEDLFHPRDETVFREPFKWYAPVVPSPEDMMDVEED